MDTEFLTWPKGCARRHAVCAVWSPFFGQFLAWHFLEAVAEVAPAGVAFPQLGKKLDAIFMNEKRFPRAEARREHLREPHA